MELVELNSEIQQLEELTAAAKKKAAEIKRAMEKGTREATEAAAMLSQKFGDSFGSEAFMKFFRKPYVTIPAGKNKVHVAVPKFIKNFHVGWLLKETDTFFVYEFDQYSAWLGDAPSELLQEINFTPEFNASIVGNQIRFDRKDREAIKKRLSYCISDGTLGDTEATIKKGYMFEIIAEMVKSGCLPFRPVPVSKADIRAAGSKIIPREYQKPVIKKFLETGAVGAFQPTGAGKSFIGMYLADIIIGKKLLFVPNITLKEQWLAYIETNLSHIKHEISVHTYNSNSKNFDGEYALTIFDECHCLPAETFSRLALIKTKYRIGLSASPHREDGRENFIFALTGFPVGLNWAQYMSESGRSYHPVHVHVVSNSRESKLRKLAELLDARKKTFIFSDSIELGKEIARRHGIPYLYSESTDRMRVIEENKVIAISRIGDEGVSCKDLERVIEVDFLGGSRRQELQRTGRLMHSEEAGRHDIIMTEKEIADHGKRVWALQEKGFQVKLHV